ncbi:IS5 family transposase [bacterium]|nr:IS5 family transposase [bacterium]
MGPTRRGKGTKWMVVVDGQGVPLGKHLASASPHESKLLETTLDQTYQAHRIQRLIYDRAADSDPLRQRLAERGIDLIAPHLRSRQKPPTQDGRKLRRYRRRWKMERTFAWLSNFRRLVVRYEHKLQLYSAFFHLACILIVMARL